MNLIDNLDLYALQNKSDDLFLLLRDYRIDSRLDRDLLNRTILKELGDMTPITNTPKMFKFMIEQFFDKWNYNIGRLIDTMYLEYNPLQDKDMKKTEEERIVTDENRQGTNHVNTEENSGYTNVNDTSAYDSGGYQPRDKSTNSAHDAILSNSNSTDKLDIDRNRELVFRNTGKNSDTSYQTLIEQEREISQFNIFDWILKQMRKELFILVY